MLVPALELRNIVKYFDGNQALDDASLAVASGAIHGIIGENGAGKSTLMQIAYGIEQADSGSILIDGALIELDCPQTAIKHGVGMLHQKISWLDRLTVLENIVLGDRVDSYLYQDNHDCAKKLQQLSREFGFRFSLASPIAELSYSERQQVDILRALYRGVRVLILDEPMALLSPAESAHLFDLFVLLKNQGISVVVVSHKLSALHQICDVISIIRNGQVIRDVEPKQLSLNELTKLMIGREVTIPDAGNTPCGDRTEQMLAIKELDVFRRSKGKLLQVAPRLSQIELSVNCGQIVAIVGLPKSGQDLLLDIIAGVERFDRGVISIAGKLIRPKTGYSISRARTLGVSYVPDPSLELGIINELSIAESALLGYQSKRRSFGAGFSHRDNVRHCIELMELWQVRPLKPLMQSGHFSGGNQQKLVLAREVNQQPKLLLLNQPTQGVDITGVELVYQRLFELRQQGGAILLVSNDLDEVISLADRVAVMHQGRLIKELSKSQLSKQKLGLLMVKGLGDE